MRNFISLVIVSLFLFACDKSHPREVMDFDNDWKFFLGDVQGASDTSFNDSAWRSLNLPHDWSIEREFDEKNPAGVGGGALPGGLGWYRKTFNLSKEDQDKKIVIQFDGVYRNSEVWINGHSLGKRPSGYISFEYDLTPNLNFDSKENVIVVKVDNSQQPNSRWYSGSGIFRDVRLVKTNKLSVDYNGTFVKTTELTPSSATIHVVTKIRNDYSDNKKVIVQTTVYDPQGQVVAETETEQSIEASSVSDVSQTLKISEPKLWDIEMPNLYEAKTIIKIDNKVDDEYSTKFGLRDFNFDVAKGFSLNGKSLKINGVCLHHDLGCLGVAFNIRAAERQLEIMKSMGVNAIRTSHNPPAPAMLDLCDKMGILVMDEMFDMWKRRKTEFDYSKDWDDWHKKDLEDFILRDRNHPSVIVWSIGNEIGEQWDSTGTTIAKELVSIVKSLDDSRPVTTANNEIGNNFIIKSGALDLVGYNYHHQNFKDFPKDYPNQKFIATETVSALETRGHYDMPSDSVRHWPISWDKPFTEGNADNTVSSYDNVCAPWGSTHEETWKEMKKYDFLSGMFVWTGFDYIGEPTPYVWPSRSSYFGIVDLAGFPKDVYYMYQSEWTNKPVLHVFPHWNWTPGKTVDVWAYYSQGDEVELFLNNKSMGIKRKQDDDLHVMWRLQYEPGKLHTVLRKNGKEILTNDIVTTGKPARIVMEVDRSTIKPSGKDLAFVTVKIVDENGVVVPDADNQVDFKIEGQGFIAGVDNGDPTSHESFKAPHRKAFHGLALVVVQGLNKVGTIKLEASAAGLTASTTEIKVE